MKYNKIILWLIPLLVLISTIYLFSVKKDKNIQIPQASENTIPLNTSKRLFSKFYSPEEYHHLLAVGIDVDWAKTQKGISAYDSKDPQKFKNRGFSHVRIRVKNPADEKLLHHLDRVIQDCLEADIIPVLAYQANKFKENPTEKNKKEAIEWWKTVVAHFSQSSPKLSFDLIIEVTDKLNKEPETLNDFYEEVVREIRKTNPHRMLFISPVVRSALENLDLLGIPSKANNFLMAEWHFFASGPSKTNPKKLWTTGTEQEKNFIQKKIHKAKMWEQKTGIKTWVGAWMPSNYNKENNYSVQEQIAFARFMTKELQKNQIPFAINSDTKLYDREAHTWREDMKEVLDVILE